MVPEVDISEDDEFLAEPSEHTEQDDQNTDSMNMPDCLVSATSMSGQRVAVGCMDHNVYVSALDNSSRLSLVSILKGHADTVTDIAVNEGQRLIASASYDGTIRIWSSDSFEEICVVDGPSCGIEKVVWHSHMSVLVAGCEDGSLWIWNIADGQVAAAYICSGHTGEITGLLARNDTVVSASVDGHLFIWDVATGISRHKLRPTGGSELHSMAIHPILGTVVVGSIKGQLSVVSLDHGRIGGTVSAHESSIEVMSFDPIGSYFCSGSIDGCIRIRDAGKILSSARHEIKVGEAAIGTLCWHRSDTTLLFAGTSDGKIYAYSPLTGECLLTLGAGDSPILAMCLSIPSMHHCAVITCSDDGTLRSFDVETEDVE